MPVSSKNGHITFSKTSMSNSTGDRLPFSLEQTQAIQHHLIRKERWRDLALFTVGVDSHLRSSDLLVLRVCDLADPNGRVRERIFGRQRKNKPTYEGYLSEPTQEAVRHWIEVSGKSSSDFLFTPIKGEAERPIRRETFGRLVKQWAEAIGLDPIYYSTKSLRKSRIRSILEAADYDYQVPKEVLNHADIRSTIYYCRLERDRAFAISRSVKFFKPMDLHPSKDVPS